MTLTKNFSRRRFIQLAALGTGSMCLLPDCSGATTGWRFFTNDEAEVVDAIAEQMIPSDKWPGGKESGVTNYIDKQLSGPFIRFRPTYRNGLAALQQTCTNLFQRRFEELTWDDQTALLEKMESGKMNGDAWREGFDITFFELIRDHSMQAYYGSPIHGGNRNKISYKMMNLDYPLIIGQNRYKT